MKLSADQKAGLYITAIVHLAVIIVLLVAQIGYQIKRENTFVLDFTKQEEKEKVEREEELRQSAAEKLEQLIAAAAGIPIRNIAVNRSPGQLKDDRNTDAEKLYRDAERLAKDLKDGQNRQENPDDYANVPDPVRNEERNQPKKTYSGPSVLSWSLEGRKASHLPIPAYRCMGFGQVTVIITVNNNGQVINAQVDEGASSSDSCLRNFAIRAARSGFPGFTRPQVSMKI